MRRRTFLTGATALLAAPAIAQRTPVLRFVPQANLTSLDPIWTTATVTSNHGYYVYDALYAAGADLKPRPQMAEGHQVSDDGRVWTIRLRDGLTFHDGTPVLSRDCAASLQRWSKRDPFGQLLDKVLDRYETPDDRTLVIRLTRPFPLLLEAIGKPDANVAWIMPERIARTDPYRAITEVVGSGPYRFLANEYVSGARSAYAKFDGYRPRQEPVDWGAGGKIAHYPRVEWTVMTDPATASAALRNGEVDWWEQPLADLLPSLAKAGITLQVDQPGGRHAFARVNHLHPPFNDRKARQAFMMAVNQEDYMRAAQGDDTSLWAVCRSPYSCGTPYARDYGKSAMRGDFEAAKRLLGESGYRGETTVVINPTDFPSIGPLGQVTADLLTKIGFKVDLRESNWGSVVQRRTSREPVEKGGWSVFHSFGSASTYATPAISTLVRQQGKDAWFGWPDDPKAEAMVQDWLAAPDEAGRGRIAEAIGQAAMEDVATIPVGQFFIKTAFRKSITGVLQGIAPYPYNVRPA
ncbi:ABC transporter substrate-binding protein [uncultured Enterovirga sp.]|uniref:ABC transporter substrate-binding protein n=1 Tax=uncultured Enterovirga sp. TaxID=2026352 RepID=UPI0035CB352C